PRSLEAAARGEPRPRGRRAALPDRRDPRPRLPAGVPERGPRRPRSRAPGRRNPAYARAHGPLPRASLSGTRGARGARRTRPRDPADGPFPARERSLEPARDARERGAPRDRARPRVGALAEPPRDRARRAASRRVERHRGLPGPRSIALAAVPAR